MRPAGAIASVASAVLLSLALPGAASALAWGPRVKIDSVALTAVSCAPGTALCVAGDRRGRLLSTAEPSHGAGATWRPTRRPIGGTAALSCPSTNLCVGVDARGIVTSTEPAAGRWRSTPIGGPIEFDAVSCAPAQPLCVAGGINNSDGDIFQNAFEVAVATSPPNRWVTVNLNGPSVMTGVSCPSTSFCVGVGNGYVAVSRDPGNGRAATWQVRSLGGGAVRWADVACASNALCVLVGGSAVAVSTDAGASWEVTPLKADLTHVACASERMCVALGGRRVLVSTDPVTGVWGTSTRVRGGSGIACASEALCAVIDSRGGVRFTSRRRH